MSGPVEASSTLSAAHFIYIPLCLLAGAVLGWLLGSRSSRDEIGRLRRLLEEEERRSTESRMAGDAGQPRPKVTDTESG
jgi:hypothetical protein